MILCDPNNFKLIEPINIAEEKTFMEGGVDIDKLKNQHSNLVNSLSSFGIKCKIISSSKSCPEQVFLRDVCFKIDSTWCICNMSTKVRAKETDKFCMVLLKSQPLADVYKFKNNIEGGDVIVFDKTIFVGISGRTKIDAVNELKDKFVNYTIIPIFLKSNILHLDCALGVVNNSFAVVYKDGIELVSYKILKKYFKLINITQKEQLNLATNFLKVDNIIFCEKSNHRVNKIIKNLGYEIAEIDFNEFHRLGGSIRCCSLDYNI